MSLAACTLPPARIREGVTLGGGGAAPMPPITPPKTPPKVVPVPPATPTPPTAPISGSASSLIILTSFGITFGATSLPASIKCTCGLMCTTCAAIGGGGGGGGGGGATSSVAIIVFGKASV